METYDAQTSYGFFLNCVLNSRVDMSVDTEDADDNFLNAYLAGVLTSRLRAPVGPVDTTKIHEIISEEGDRVRILKLQREADKGLVFHGVFSDKPEGYEAVGIAYRSAADICNRFYRMTSKMEDLLDPNSPTPHVGGTFTNLGEIFSYLDDNLDLCMDLLHHVSWAYLSRCSLTEAELHLMTLPQNPDDALDSFLGYYNIYILKKQIQKKERE
ncbi:MAG: hypothetical protein KKG75_04335 [Nanoarchaeota archaeon]|nr:hypothetical protein [Nanoarchaeota archaeon]